MGMGIGIGIKIEVVRFPTLSCFGRGSSFPLKFAWVSFVKGDDRGKGVVRFAT